MRHIGGWLVYILAENMSFEVLFKSAFLKFNVCDHCYALHSDHLARKPGEVEEVEIGQGKFSLAMRRPS